MRFDLKRPCGNCPFRNEKPFHLGESRASEISGYHTKEDKTFQCHKTINKEEQQCAGMLLVAKNEGLLYDNLMVRLATVVGLFNEEELCEKAANEVYSTFADFIEDETYKEESD